MLKHRKLKLHFPEFPSLYSSELAYAPRDILYEIWKAEVKQQHPNIFNAEKVGMSPQGYWSTCCCRSASSPVTVGRLLQLFQLPPGFPHQLPQVLAQEHVEFYDKGHQLFKQVSGIIGAGDSEGMRGRHGSASPCVFQLRLHVSFLSAHVCFPFSTACPVDFKPIHRCNILLSLFNQLPPLHETKSSKLNPR